MLRKVGEKIHRLLAEAPTPSTLELRSCEHWSKPVPPERSRHAEAPMFLAILVILVHQFAALDPWKLLRFSGLAGKRAAYLGPDRIRAHGFSPRRLFRHLSRRPVPAFSRFCGGEATGGCGLHGRSAATPDLLW